MKLLISIFVLITCMSTQTLFDINKDSDIRYWRIVNDTVMGGRSLSSFELSPEGHGVFAGQVSLENNGGFSSVRYRFEEKNVDPDSKIVITLKGDGKNYQFRIKDDSRNYYSYITTFSTSGEWQEIEIPLRDMYASFRGRRLDMPNFSKDSIEEIVFLIGNKQPETFKLLIDKIAID